MTTIWGRLEQIAEGRPEGWWVQIRTAVPGKWGNPHSHHHR